MNADPLLPVDPSTPLRDAVNAASVNAWNETARRVLRDAGPTGGGSPAATVAPSLTVLVQNDSGGNLTAGAVLAITGVVVDPTDYPSDVRRRPTFTGDTPDDAANPFVILAEAIPDGEIGRAVIFGVAVCTVNLEESTHQFAGPRTSAAKLYSATAGPARILWASGSSGDVTAAVWLAQDLEASDTAPGWVSLEEQWLGDGLKKFQAGWMSRPVEGDEADVPLASAFHFDGDNPGATITASTAGQYGLRACLNAITDDPSASFFAGNSSWGLGGWSDGTESKFYVYADAVTSWGASGTTANGDTVVGGIITSVGGGGGSSDFDGGTW